MSNHRAANPKEWSHAKTCSDLTKTQPFNLESEVGDSEVISENYESVPITPFRDRGDNDSHIPLAAKQR
jgi:hypothetical protein